MKIKILFLALVFSASIFSNNFKTKELYIYQNQKWTKVELSTDIPLYVHYNSDDTSIGWQWVTIRWEEYNGEWDETYTTSGVIDNSSKDKAGIITQIQQYHDLNGGLLRINYKIKDGIIISMQFIFSNAIFKFVF